MINSTLRTLGAWSLAGAISFGVYSVNAAVTHADTPIDPCYSGEPLDVTVYEDGSPAAPVNCAVRLSDDVAYWLNWCPGYQHVYMDPATGGLYGDQYAPFGILSGRDCFWS